MRAGLATVISGIPLREYEPLIRDFEEVDTYAMCVGESAIETFAGSAFVSSITTKSRIISGVATWSRPPVTTALAATTVDELSGGRYELGIGTMPVHWMRDHYGIDPQRPLARMREYVEVIRKAWKAHSGNTCEFRGEFYQITGYRRIAPPLRDEIPIYLAATRPGMAKLTGEIAEGALVNWLHTREWIDEVMEPAIAAGEKISGNKCQRAAMVRVLVEPDPVRAREILRPSFALYQQTPYFPEVAAYSGWDAKALPDALVDAMTVHGSVDEVVSTIRSRYGHWADWLEISPPSAIPGSDLRQAYIDLLPVLRELNLPEGGVAL